MFANECIDYCENLFSIRNYNTVNAPFVWLLFKYLKNFEFELSINLLVHIPFQRFPNSTVFIYKFIKNYTSF